MHNKHKDQLLRPATGEWLEEDDKMKTAFQDSNIGFFECNRMSFGLCNAPATFQRLMVKAM